MQEEDGINLRILYVEDNPLDRELVRDALEKEHGGFEITEATSRQEFEERLAGDGYDVVLTDFNILGFEGLQVIDSVRAKHPLLPVVIVTGTGSEEVAVEAMKRGAADYVIKTPTHIRRLPQTILRVVEKKRLAEEKRRAEEAFLESEKRFNFVMEATNDGLWDWNVQTGQVYFSPHWYTMLGYEPYELPPSYDTWADLLHPEDRKRTEEIVQEHLNGKGKGFELEIRMRTKREAWKWILARGKVVERDSKGQPLRATGTHVDISKLKETEKALQESAEFNRAVIESSMDCMTVLDLEGRLLFMNRGGQRLLEIDDINPYLNAPWIDFWEGDDRQAVVEAISRAREREIGSFEGSSPTATGTPKWWHVMIAPIIGAGNVIERLIAVSRDITDRTLKEQEQVELEKRLRQAQKMEAIGTLAGGIAHDFNNILGIIVGNIELADDDVPEGNPALMSLQEARQACMRAKDLVQQILTFSRVEEKEFKPFDIVSVVAEGLKMLRSSIPTTIDIQQDIFTKSAVIIGDPTQVQQVLMNLCTNAVQAMEEMGGVLHVALADIELDDEAATAVPDLAPGNYIRISVSDTGHGVEPDIIAKIFDPYFTTKEVGRGTGMGLAVVHGIVQRHGGAIKVYSEPGKGTTFHVFFPKLEREIDAPTQTTEALIGGSECILFVDDEEPLARLGQRMLEKLGYTVVSKTSSVETLEAFRQSPGSFDLVITDMTMPNMTGDVLAGELIRIRPDIPVILCTGFSHRIDEKKAKALGIRAFVMKPIVMLHLAKTIRKVLDEE